MSQEELFFMRKPWVYDPKAPKHRRPDAHLGFDTRALHAGFRPLKDMGKFNTFTVPIIQSMTFPYERFDKIPYPVYGRTKTPTAAVLEERLASLEGGESAVLAGSGSQALFNLIFTIARPGDNVVTTLNTFGEGYKQASSIFPERCHVEFRFVKDPANRVWCAEHIFKRSLLVWVESPRIP
jgi:O-acetylhomoserine/O-acetylserine sulfhydrylase-like pyridoxal-dependent enzyme